MEYTARRAAGDGWASGRSGAAGAVTATPALLWYGPALLASAILTGAFTGLGAMYLIKTLRRYDKMNGKGESR